MNFKKLQKSLVAVAFALSCCFSGVVNLISALDAQYYNAVQNQLVGNQAALANLQLIRAWHDRHPLNHSARARDFVVDNIRDRFQTFERELTLPECTWQDEIHNLRLLGETLIFAVKPLEENREDFTNTMLDLSKLPGLYLIDLIDDWDDEIWRYGIELSRLLGVTVKL